MEWLERVRVSDMELNSHCGPLRQSCYARQGDRLGTSFGGNVHLGGAAVAQAASALRHRWSPHQVS
jgi:hypothetical protein